MRILRAVDTDQPSISSTRDSECYIVQAIIELDPVAVGRGGMLSYLTAEAAFVRAFCNRSLLLIFLCALTRTGEKLGNASALGLSLNINPGIIVIFGPLLVVFLLVGLKIEADSLRVARDVVLSEATSLPASLKRPGIAVLALFFVPVMSTVFFIIQYLLNVVPHGTACNQYFWKQFYDPEYLMIGTASTYCVGNISDNMPWIYPPFQIYLYLICLIGSIRMSYAIAKQWSQARALSK